MPAFPAMIGARSVSAPIAAVLPVDVAKRHAASTFGPIDPAEGHRLQRVRRSVPDLLCVGNPQST